MANQIASLLVKIGADITGLQKGLTSTKQGLTGVADTAKSLGLAVGAAMGTAAVAVIAFKKTMEFGKEGAAIIQVRSAFDNLTDTIGDVPAVLAELRKATQGTVTDMDLMSATNKILAGTSGELAKAIGDNLPQLWAMANAIADLRPELGSAADVFLQLAQAIQSGRTMSLAGMNIAIKSTDAYNKYGEAIGKTGAKLSKAEQQQAILNSVVDAGTTVIEQAAKVNDSNADSIERMETSLANLGDTAKEKAAPSIAFLADRIAGIIGGMDAAWASTKEGEAAILSSSKTFTEYKVSLEKAADAVGAVVQANGDLTKNGMVVIRGFAKTSEAAFDMAKGLSEVSVSADMAEMTMRGLGAATEEVGEQIDTSGWLVEKTADAWATYGQRLTETASSVFGVAASMNMLSEAEYHVQTATDALSAGLSGRLTEAMTTYSETLEPLIKEQEELNTKIANASKVYGTLNWYTLELKDALLKNESAQLSALEAMQKVTAEMIYQAAAASLDVQGQTNLAYSLGLIDQASYSLITQVGVLTNKYDLMNDGLVAGTDNVAGYQAELALLYQSLANVEGTQAAGPIADTATAAADLGKTAPGLEDYSEGAEGIASSSDLAATAVDKQNTALGATPGVADPAATSIDGVKDAAKDAKKPVDDLTSALKLIPTQKTTLIKILGVEAAIAQIAKIKGALASIPTTVSSTVVVNTVNNTTTTPVTTSPTNNTTYYVGGVPTVGGIPLVSGGPGIPTVSNWELVGFAGGGAFSAGHPFIAGEKGPELIVPKISGEVYSSRDTKNMLNAGAPQGGDTVNVQNTYNVYNPLAAKMLADQRDRNTRNKYARLMNG